MPLSSQSTIDLVDYRYFVCDLMTGAVLAEVPFKSVSYTRSLTEPGSFSGDIAVTPETYNLSIYENTLPGKTAVYAVRNGVCVWGGIIWGRTYNLIDKTVSVSAAEFTSYLSRRVVWKTWNSAYQASIVSSGGTVTITLDFGQYAFTVGEAVWVDFGEGNRIFNGYFSVDTVSLTSDSRSVFTSAGTFVDATGQTKTIPDLKITALATVETRQSPYQYVHDLLKELRTDLADFDFANDLIRPGVDLFNVVETASRSGNIATITTTKKQELVPGQKVNITDIGSGFDTLEAIVSEVLDDYSFTYANTGSNASITVAEHVVTIKSYQRKGNIVTFNTTSSHGLSDKNIIFVENVGESIDGYTAVYGTPTSSTSFQAVIGGDDIALSVTDSTSTTYPPRATRVGAIKYSTFGEYTTLGDLGFDISQIETIDADASQKNPIIRGFQLRTVTDILDEYATKTNGFEYRIDVSYDGTTNSFKKAFTLLPLVPGSLKNYLATVGSGWTGAVPASAYGAENLVFEYPGNIRAATFEENADDAATRFFVQGKDSNLSAEASQPYSAAANHKLLRQGWPILDHVQDMDSDDETVLWKQAARLLGDSVPPISTFAISVNGSVHPKLGTYSPGDWCAIKLNDDFVSLRADSYLEQDYGTDNGVLVRKIISYSVSVPDAPSYPEEVKLELVTEPTIPISGVVVIDGKVFNGN